MSGWRVLCPAKLNLFLSVGPPDRTGYHPLRTVFQSIDLFDEVVVRRAEADAFWCNDPSVPSENTITRSLRLMRELLDLPPLAISLTKRIPVQAGLGGGSSDAAGFMRLACAMVGRMPPPAELLGVAVAVGADVPFFLVGGRARGEGYGERLTPVRSLPESYLVVKPAVGCDTAGAFARLDASERQWLDFPVADVLGNDFESVAPAESRSLLGLLRSAGFEAGLTGSGSAVFARMADESFEAAARAIEGFDCRSWRARTVEGLCPVESF